MENEILKSNIMRRVYMIYIARTMLRPLAVELAFLAALVGVTAFYVSLPNVYHNFMSAGLGASYGFITAAFIETDMIVKVLFVAVVGIVVLALYHMAKGVTSVALRLV